MRRFVVVMTVTVIVFVALALPAPAQEDSRLDGAVRLTTPPGGASDQNPAFAPDGAQMIFTRFEQGYNAGPSGVYRLDLASGAVDLLAAAPDSDTVNLPGASWNAATGRIVFASDREAIDESEIWTAAPDGSDWFRVTDHETAEYFVEPSFAPDGDWIVFEVNGDAQQGSIWKVRADGAQMVRLTDGPGGGTDDRRPNWSPTGARILFQRRTPGQDDPDDWKLYTMNPNGGDLRQVTGAAGAADASWSPDGGWIVYSSDATLPAASLYVIPAEGGTPIRVTYDDDHDDGAPSWSPDGRWIAFESAPGGDAPAALWRIAAPVLGAPAGLPACVVSSFHPWTGYTPVTYNIDGSFTLRSTFGAYQTYTYQQVGVVFPDTCAIAGASYANHQGTGASSVVWLDGPVAETDGASENPTRTETTFYFDQTAYALMLRGEPDYPFTVTVTLRDAVAAPEKPLFGVDDFLYQLQNLDFEAAGMTAYDLVVMDYSADGSAEGVYAAEPIAALKDSPGGPKIVLAYLSIGEAEDYRFYWDDAWRDDPPAWLDAENPDWAGNYKVRYWDPAWQAIIFEYLDYLLDAGFDGAYLDIVDAYWYYEEQGRESAAPEMIAFVGEIARRARERDPDFYIFPQNAAELVEYDPAYLDIVDGIGQEDIYYGYEADDVMTPPDETEWLEGYLDRFVPAGKLVLTIDYATTPSHVADAYEKSRAKGYVPFVTVRDLDRLIVHPAHPPD